MALYSTSDGAIELPDFAVDAAARYGKRLAKLTGDFLRRSGFCPQLKDGELGSCGLPADVLLDLGSLLLLRTWHENRLCEFLSADVPSLEDAGSAFVQQLADVVRGNSSFLSRLDQVVFANWVQSVAWDGPLELQADLVVGEIDEDTLVDAIAELIWPHRHDSAIDGDHANQVVNP